jgi:enterochelin esterase-like enzyme
MRSARDRLWVLAWALAGCGGMGRTQGEAVGIGSSTNGGLGGAAGGTEGGTTAASSSSGGGSSSPIAGVSSSGGSGNGGGAATGSSGVTGGPVAQPRDGGGALPASPDGGKPLATDAGSSSAAAWDSGSPTDTDPGVDGDGEYNLLPPYDNQPPGLTQQAGVPVGTLTASVNFPSAVYNGTMFSYRLYVPAQYNKAVPAALMVTQDGRQWIDRFSVIYDNLIAAGKAPITIAVFVPASTPAMRSQEYDTVDDTYSKFVMQDLLPLVKANYNITDDPAGRATSGNSSGGIAAFSIAWFRPDSFHRVLTSSGSFVNIGGKGGDMYPAMIAAAPMTPIRAYFSSSLGDMPGWLDANRAMANALKAKGNHYRFIWGDASVGHGGGAMLNSDLPTAMEWLWRGYVQPK